MTDRPIETFNHNVHDNRDREYAFLCLFKSQDFHIRKSVQYGLTSINDIMDDYCYKH